MNIEELKLDREAGVALWVPVPTPFDSNEEKASARRIARLPDLEAAFLEAVELLGKIEKRDADFSYHIGVTDFLDRFK